MVKQPGDCCASPVCEFKTQQGSFTGTGSISGKGVGKQNRHFILNITINSNCFCDAGESSFYHSLYTPYHILIGTICFSATRDSHLLDLMSVKAKTSATLTNSNLHAACSIVYYLHCKN